VFTGIIEEVGTVGAIRTGPQGATLTIRAPHIGPSVKIGESVAVNGVCLTAARVMGDEFTCDLSVETLRRSSLRQVRAGAIVNLERALALGDRLGGHMVQGHVDGVGNLASSVPSGEGWDMEFTFPQELERFLVQKGSIAVDGISLTIASLGNRSFKVAVIPHTYRASNLGRLKIGDPVNLETDLLGKYFERFIQLGLVGAKRRPSAVETLLEGSS
jgi:riboflavin synthase